MKRWLGFHFRQTGALAKCDPRPEVVQWVHCNGSQFRSAVLHLLGHFGIWRAFVMSPAAMKYFGGHMAKIIEFYIPQSFRKVSKWFPPAECGKVLAFPLAVRKSA